MREKRLLNYQPNIRVLCPLVRKAHILLPLGEQRPQEGHEDPGAHPHGTHSPKSLSGRSSPRGAGVRG